MVRDRGTSRVVGKRGGDKESREGHLPTWYRRPESEKMVMCLSYALPARGDCQSIDEVMEAGSVKRVRGISPDMIAVVYQNRLEDIMEIN